MKRSTTIAIIIVFISIVGGGLLGFYFYINSTSKKEATLGTRVETGGSFGSPRIDNTTTLPGNASSTDTVSAPLITENIQAETKQIPVLRKIFQDPVAGVGFFSKNIFATSSAVTETVLVANGTSTARETSIITPAQTRLVGTVQTIQFVERATGHIYETATSSLTLSKLSNTTIPKIYEAMFISKDSLLLRGLYESTDIVSTRLANLQLATPTSTEKVLVTKEQSRDMLQVALSPTKNKLLSLQKNSPILRISNVDGSSPVTLFDSEFNEWLISWPIERFITLTTKASAFVEGYMYTINTTSRDMQKVIGDKLGLTTLMSPDGKKVLYSESSSGSTYLYTYDLQTKNSRPLFFRTFAEKCIWSNKNADIVFCAVPRNIALGDYPDVWYLGLTSFTDSIWRINIKTGQTNLVAHLDELGGEDIDVVNPQLNSDDSYLTFNNKKDLSLWGLQLTLPSIATSTATTTTSTTPATSTRARN
jgi:hypothetical protein